MTLAGHSRRFQAAGYDIPKPFLKIGDKKMIEHAVSMFDPSDEYYFIINEIQNRDYPEHVEELKRMLPRTHVVVIPPHEKGPTFSAMAVEGIDDEDEVIVSYCDFFVDWDYARFKRFASDYDAALPVFRGFQPASFGHTFYAYIRTDGNDFLELREKKSWTDKRWEEPASTGIYYFKRWKDFRDFGQEVIEDTSRELPEAYTSLLYNPMKASGRRIGVFDVERFLCLGTPEDVEQYQFWFDYFEVHQPQLKALKEKTGDLKNGVNLVPMAGKGSRFQKDGFRVTKPLIQICGEPMMVAASNSFPPAKKWVFLLRDTELAKHPIEKAIHQRFEQARVIPVDHDTSGQAATCLLAEREFEKDESLFIASCDYQTIYDSQKWESLIADESLDGVIWTYRLRSQLFKNPNAFAYCRVAEDGENILEVVEKKTISDSPGEDPMVVGTFWYRRAQDFVEGARSMMADGITVNGEHYVGTSINALLKVGKKFKIFDVTQWISFGDPFELQVYEYWEEHFHQRRGL